MLSRLGLCTLSLMILASTGARAQSTLFTIYGDQGSDFFGSAVADAQDVDGDGIHDFIVGAPLHGKTAYGYSRVYSGKTGDILAQWNGDAIIDWFGFAVSGAGDVNHDGHADLLVGAPKEGNGSSIGTVRLFSGKDGTVIYEREGAAGDPSGDWFGYAVSGVGDVDKDGTDDFTVGAPLNDQFGSNSGLVTLFSGATGDVLRTWHGQIDDYLGSALGSVGDLTSDGAAEILVGAPVDAPARTGYAQVFSGGDGQVLYTLTGDHAEDWFGRWVAGGHDVNKDGVNDFIVAAHKGLWSYARVFSGMDGTPLWTVSGSAASAFATSACTVGDMNGDGYAEFAVGEPGADDVGAVHVFSGADGTLFFSRFGCKDTPGGGLGWSVASVGDINGDGLGDLAFGSPFESWFPQIDQGAIRVLAGTCCPSAWLNYGSGWRGTHGIPTFELRAYPDLCTQVPVVVGNSSGTDAAGLIFIGAVEDQILTALDGTLWLRPMVTTVVPLHARGDRFTLSIPCDPAARGAVVLAQCLEIDAGASKGVSFSRALKAVLGD